LRDASCQNVRRHTLAFFQLLMPRIIRLILALLVAPAIAFAQETSLAAPVLRALDSSVSAAGKAQPFNYSAYAMAAERARTRVWELIAHDSLRTADDFVLASKLAGDPTGFFENRRVEHELALVALVMRHPDAMRRAAMTWDALNWSIGRGQRFGSFKRDGVATNMDPVPAPAAVLAVVNDLPTARAKAGNGGNLPELQQIRDADQTARSRSTRRRSKA
jgi:hypothetical protein